MIQGRIKYVDCRITEKWLGKPIYIYMVVFQFSISIPKYSYAIPTNITRSKE